MMTATGCPRTPRTGTDARHVVGIIETDSWMYDIVGADKLENVSSWHHQAVTDVTSDTGPDRGGQDHRERPGHRGGRREPEQDLLPGRAVPPRE